MNYFIHNRRGRSILNAPLCPFCGCLFERPHEIEIDIGFILGGRCECGAVYTCDPTGRNLGEVYMNALFMVSGGDWNRASSMDPDINFEEKVLNYDLRTHSVVGSSFGSFQRMSSGKIVFMRLKNRDSLK
jgi:hypothetical protein